MRYKILNDSEEAEFYTKVLGLTVPVEKVNTGFSTYHKTDRDALIRARVDFAHKVNNGEIDLKVELIGPPSRQGSIGKLEKINYWDHRNPSGQRYFHIQSFEVSFDNGRGIKELARNHAVILDQEESQATDIKYVFNKKDPKKRPDIPTPKNKWGQELNVGRLVVAYTRSAGLQVGRITRWTRSNVWINLIPLAEQTRKGEEILKEPQDCFFLPEAFEGEYFLFAMLGGELPDPDDLSFFEDYESPTQSG